MPHALGRNLARILLEVSEQKDIALEPLVVRGMLVERGLMTPEMRKFYESVVATPEPDAAQVIAYVDLLKARASRLRLVEISTRISNYLEDRADGADIVDFVGTLIPALMDIQQQRLARSSLTAAEIAGKLVKEITTGQMGSLLGYSISPFDRLNEVLSGLRRGFYYGLAGAPRRGKTNLALELAAIVAAMHKIPVLYYSWEQTNRILLARLLAREVLVNPAQLLSSEAGNPRVQERLRA
jgi:replicative DNA helicase